MERTYPYGEGTIKIVSTRWLHEHLRKEEFGILDAQPNVYDYIVEHIPGAVYFNEGLLRASGDGLPARFVPAEAIEPVLRAAGLRNDVPVVVYTGKGAYRGWGDGLEQTMVAYALARYGHNSVYVLDGGIDKWKQEGLPLSRDFPEVRESGYLARVRGDYYIELEELREIRESRDVVILDARPREAYEGQGIWPKPGHIPGALSLPWPRLMDERNPALLRSDDELRDIADSYHIPPDKMIIIYCGTGREATNEFIFFKFYLGYPRVRVYEGSFMEWSSRSGNPVVTGSTPLGEPVPAGF